MIPSFSVKKPFTVAVVVIFTLILGSVSFTKMTTDLMPSMNLPFIIVNTVYPGASPEKVESSVTRPLEKALATTSGLKNMTSTSSENSSMIMLEFEQSMNMDSVMIDMNSKIDMVKGYFDDVVQSPMLIKMNPDMMPIMVLSVDVSEMTIKEVTKYMNEEIIPNFERIEGVASIDAQGLVEDQIKITLDKEKIDELNEKVIKTIEDGFSEQETSLNDAKKELSDSKSSLETELNEQIDSLDSGLKEVQTGIKNLEDAINEIGKTKDELQSTIDDLTVEKAKLSIQLDTLNIEISSSQNEVIIAELSAKVSGIEEGIKGIEEGISGAREGINVIDSVSELKEQEVTLTNTKMTLEKELSSAKAEIEKGEKELEQGIESLADAKENALKSADMTQTITPEMIGNILMAQNFSMPAGYIKEGDTEYSVKVGDEFTSKDEISNLLLFNLDEVGEVRLQDVSSVEFVDNSNDTYTNINGNNGVILTFQKSSGYSTTDVTKSLNTEILSVENGDSNVNITTLMDQGVYIGMIIDNVLSNLIYGGILAIIILLLFLKSIKTTMVVAFSIPISVFFTIVMMYFSGITLNIISLSGLALGVGMLVDNSIVVVENIYRLKSEGYSSKEAAILGTKQVSGAIFASTLTTICVFLPIVFTEGMTKDMFMDMALTISFSLIASLAVALTVVPAMSSKLVNNLKEPKEDLFSKFTNVYLGVLDKCLRYKFIVLLLTFSLLGFAGYKSTQMGMEFMPEMESNEMSATLSLEDSILTREDLRVRSDLFVEIVKAIEGVDTVGVTEQSMMGSNEQSMSAYIILSEDKTISNSEIVNQIVEKTSDLELNVDIMTSNMDMSVFAGQGISIQIKGVKLETIQEIAKEIGEIVSEVEGTVDVKNGLENSDIEVKIVVNKDVASEYGLTVIGIYQEIASMLTTENSSTTVSFSSGEYPIIVYEESDVTKSNILEKTIKAKKDNEEIDLLLSEVVTLEETQALKDINHDNQVKYLNVTSMIEDGYNVSLVSREVEKAISEYEVTEGYTVDIKGENETIMETLMDMVLMCTLAIIFVYLVMVSQFQSLVSPFIVMFTIPLAFTGGLLALIMTNTLLSVTSMLGFLVLSGIVVNNGIVFVDYINQLREEGLSKREAIMETGKSRIRPIFMTALTTILAMSTMAFGVGMGAEMNQGLAIVTIGGLIYSTILTLIIIPIMYDIIHRKDKVIEEM